MSIKIKCQTEGAIYKTDISDDNISISISLPFQLDISGDEALVLEANIHNMLEIVLSKYFIDKQTNELRKFKDFK